jgi:hypothetical protein
MSVKAQYRGLSEITTGSPTSSIVGPFTVTTGLLASRFQVLFA